MADDKKQTSAAEKQDDFAARIADSIAKAVADATVKVQERIHPIEARASSKVSSFNPEGMEHRPKLQRRYLFSGAELKEKFLTNDEIVALNKISKPGDYHRNQWHVRVRRDDSDRETVLIDLPVKSIDQRMELPNSLIAIVDAILAEHAAKQAAVVA